MRWLIKPITREIENEVSAMVAEAIRSLQEGPAVLEESGFDPKDMAALSDLDTLAGFSVFVAAAYYAERLVQDWEGIEDPATGEKARRSPRRLSGWRCVSARPPAARR